MDHNILKQDYLPAYLDPYLRGNGFHGTIALQTCKIDREINFLLQLQLENSFIKGVVGWIYLEAEGLKPALSRYAGKVSGFRLSLEGEPNGDYVLGASFQRGIRMLDDFSYTIDLLVRPHHLNNCARLADKFPHPSFVIDHLGKPNYSETGFESWASDIKNLSERKNVFFARSPEW